MSDTNTATNAARFEVRVTADSHFAWLRTRFSVERTMMSLVRTAVSLIGFGFAIVQFFERLQQTPGSPAGLSARCAPLPGPCTDGLRRSDPSGLNLAILVDAPLSVERILTRRSPA